ncbi:MAG: hypothetical protein ACTSUE_12635 [Promethearchaeota archaeon]
MKKEKGIFRNLSHLHYHASRAARRVTPGENMPQDRQFFLELVPHLITQLISLEHHRLPSNDRCN